MGRKAKRIGRKRRQRKERPKHRISSSFYFLSSDSESSGNEKSSNRNSTSSPVPGPSNLVEIVGKLQTAVPTVQNTQENFFLINLFMDNQCRLTIREIIDQGLVVLLFEGMQLQPEFVTQYYATHSMLSIIKRMTEEHVRELIPMGLEKGIKGALECHACLVIQEVLQICSLIGAMSSDLHEEIANWTSSRVISLLMHDYPGVPPNFIYALASFVQELCHRKPMSELVVSYTATCARSLVQNKDENCREAGLNIILEIARNEGYIMIFQHSFLKKIVELFESAVENEAKLAFLIVGSFVKQHNDNTNAVLQLGLINKIVPFIIHYSDVELVSETCSIVQNLLSRKKKKKHAKAIVDSNIMLLLLKFLNEGNPTYKYELCVALHSLNVVWKREDAVKAAGVQYIEIMCNILKNNNSDHVACCVSVMHSILEACLTLKANFELQQAKDIIKALKADKYLAEFVDHTQEDSSIHNLADDLYNLCLGNIKVDSDEEEDHAETEDASRA